MGGAAQDEAQAYIYLSNYPEGSVAREGYIEGIIEGLREAAVPEDAFKFMIPTYPMAPSEPGSNKTVGQENTNPKT